MAKSVSTGLELGSSGGTVNSPTFHTRTIPTQRSWSSHVVRRRRPRITAFGVKYSWWTEWRYIIRDSIGRGWSSIAARLAI